MLYFYILLKNNINHNINHMKISTRLFIGMAMLLSGASMMAAVGTLNINGVDQQVDTIIPKHNVGPGTTYAFYHLPNRPLTIHVTEIDLSNQYVQMEVCNGGSKAVASETPSNMYKRNDSPGHDMVAVFNGDFYHTSATDGTATGMSRMGLIIKEEVEINPVGMPMFVLTPNRESYMDAVHFSASVKSSTGATNRIHTLNSHYLEFDTADDNGERMILYTPAYGTATNNVSGGTKVVVTPKEGSFKFAANTTISCIVESIADNTGSTAIPAGKAVLYGTGANETFLKGLSVGEECTITISNTLPSNGSVKDIKEALGGSGHFLLQNGNVVISGNPDVHPRTFMGLSQDKKIVYAVQNGGTQVRGHMIKHATKQYHAAQLQKQQHQAAAVLSQSLHGACQEGAGGQQCLQPLCHVLRIGCENAFGQAVAQGGGQCVQHIPEFLGQGHDDLLTRRSPHPHDGHNRQQREHQGARKDSPQSQTPCSMSAASANSSFVWAADVVQGFSHTTCLPISSACFAKG